MRGSKEVGFTIIEVMLFLGITGFMAVMIFVSTGNSINIQRYRDSVTSLQSIIQEQYSEVANVVNNNHNASDPAACAGMTPTARGQSDCVILGKYITNNLVNNKIIIKDVVGKEPAITAPTPTNDSEALQQYVIGTSLNTTTDDEYQLNWGSSFISTTNLPLNFSILIARSPLSGVIRTFINPTNTDVPPLDLVTILPGPPSFNGLSNKIEICINSNGLFAGKKSSVFIDAGASSASGVKTLGDASSGCM